MMSSRLMMNIFHIYTAVDSEARVEEERTKGFIEFKFGFIGSEWNKIC